MKSMIAFAAVAALVSSVSIASAQTMAPKVTGNGAFCSEASGVKDCKFQTLADCQKQASASGAKCVPNAGTTGSGTQSPADGMKKPDAK